MLSALDQNTPIKYVLNHAKDDIIQIKQLSLDQDVPHSTPVYQPLATSQNREDFFRLRIQSYRNLSSTLVSRVEGIDVMRPKGDTYNLVHVLNLDTGESDWPLSFVPALSNRSRCHLPIADLHFHRLYAILSTAPRSQHTHSRHLRL